MYAKNHQKLRKNYAIFTQVSTETIINKNGLLGYILEVGKYVKNVEDGNMLVVGENGRVKYVVKVQKGPGYRISLPTQIVKQLPFEPNAFEIKLERDRIVLIPIKVRLKK